MPALPLRARRSSARRTRRSRPPRRGGSRGALLAAALLAAAAPVAARAARLPDPRAQGAREAASGSAPADPRAELVEHVLANGWTFLLLPRHAAPTVAFDTYALVGSIDEGPGETGLAHVFEHMAFKGSDRLGSLDWEAERVALAAVDERYLAWRAARAAGDVEAAAAARAEFEAARERAAAFVVPEAFGRWLEDAGGAQTLNARARADGTHFHVALPASHVELWCWLEAERFARPVLREFYRERDAILEERRTYNESDPFGVLAEALFLEAFHVHPYRNPVIGFAADVAHHSRPEARAFFRRHYGARRLVTAVVGDFEPDELIPLLERYLGAVPPGEPRPPVSAVEPPQQAERRVEVTFPAEPIVACGWRAPAATHPDHFALLATARVLGAGRGSRLRRRLVREDALASQVFLEPGLPGDLQPNLIVFFGLPTAGPDALLAALDEEIARLAAEGPTADELAGTLRRARVETWRTRRSNADTALALTEAWARYGDWRLAFDLPERLARVTAGDVQRVARTYLVPERRTVAVLVPPPAEPAAPAVEPSAPPADAEGASEEPDVDRAGDLPEERPGAGPAESPTQPPLEPPGGSPPESPPRGGGAR